MHKPANVIITIASCKFARVRAGSVAPMFKSPSRVQPDTDTGALSSPQTFVVHWR